MDAALASGLASSSPGAPSASEASSLPLPHSDRPPSSTQAAAEMALELELADSATEQGELARLGFWYRAQVSRVVMTVARADEARETGVLRCLRVFAFMVKTRDEAVAAGSTLKTDDEVRHHRAGEKGRDKTGHGGGAGVREPDGSTT